MRTLGYIVGIATLISLIWLSYDYYFVNWTLTRGEFFWARWQLYLLAVVGTVATKALLLED